jgi:hypothetical protein
MRECSDHQARFTPYLDQELATEERQQLEAHLASCPHCAAEWRLFTLTLDRIASLRDDQPPPDLLPGIHAKLHRPHLWTRLRDLIHQYDFSMSLPMAAATVVLAMGIGLFLKVHFQPMEPTNQTTQLATRRAAPLIIPDSRLTAVTTAPASSFPQARAAHPPTTPEPDTLHPDIFITVRAETPRDLLLLRQSLEERRFIPDLVSQHGLMLRLHPDDLPLLREALGDRQAVVFPPETITPGYPHHKELLLVAIRLQ